MKRFSSIRFQGRRLSFYHKYIFIYYLLMSDFKYAVFPEFFSRVDFIEHEIHGAYSGKRSTSYMKRLGQLLEDISSGRQKKYYVRPEYDEIRRELGQLQPEIVSRTPEQQKSDKLRRTYEEIPVEIMKRKLEPGSLELVRKRRQEEKQVRIRKAELKENLRLLSRKCYDSSYVLGLLTDEEILGELGLPKKEFNRRIMEINPIRKGGVGRSLEVLVREGIMKEEMVEGEVCYKINLNQPLFSDL